MPKYRITTATTTTTTTRKEGSIESTTVHTVTKKETMALPDESLRSLAVLGAIKGGIGFLTVMAALESGHFTGPYGVVALMRPYVTITDEQQDRISKIEEKGGRVLRLDTSNHTETVTALRGADAVLSLMLASPKSLPAVEAFVDDCIEAGVKRFIPDVFGVDYTKNLYPCIAHWFLSSAKWFGSRNNVHDLLVSRSDKISFTEIINGYFADATNLQSPALFGIDWTNMTARFTGPAATAPVSFTFRRDAARMVVEVLRNPAISKNRRLRVEGGRMSVDELVALYERVSGRVFDKKILEASALEDAESASAAGIEGFSYMALKGLAAVNPGGEEPVDNALFPRWRPAGMDAHAREMFELERDAVGSRERTEK
ncbi:hypothetical protein BC830DRAFT_1086667 [Chytriomyces sp. MP71]|nr:hypothetical protein BC830DRAFT_1086667 [Chytriomyces sp. MP71]